MTVEEISRIKEHIEIHARREPASAKITVLLWEAVEELEHIPELEKENAELKAKIEELKKYYEGFECVFDFKAFMKGGKH